MAAQSEAGHVRRSGVCGTAGTFGGVETLVGVDLAFEPVSERSAGFGGGGPAVVAVRPPGVGGDTGSEDTARRHRDSPAGTVCLWQ